MIIGHSYSTPSLDIKVGQDKKFNMYDQDEDDAVIVIMVMFIFSFMIMMITW